MPQTIDSPSSLNNKNNQENDAIEQSIYGDGRQVNPHFLKQLIDLAANHTVETSEDIYAENGMKLLNKGSQISDALYERIVSHKLRRPLEQTLVVADGIDSQQIANTAERLLDEHASMRALIGNKNGLKNAQDVLKKIELTPPAHTLLNVYESKGNQRLDHLTKVALIALGFTQKLQPNAPAFYQSIATAGIFHDVGEAYLNPELLNRRGNLSPEEWKQIAVHPVVADAVLKQIDGLSPSVSQMIMEHHERLDGFGYPRGTKGSKISVGGQILSVAETISGLMSKKTLPLKHAEIALKIVPGEYARPLINLVAQAFSESHESAPEPEEAPQEGTLTTSVHQLFMEIANILTVFDLLQNASKHFSETSRNLLTETWNRFGMIQKAFSSTGLDSTSESPALLDFSSKDSAFLRFESQFVLDEILWRLRELARELALRALRLPDAEAQSFLMLSAALNGESQSEIGMHSEKNIELF